jgi:uncharacterized protein YutE (UPF0331/DUF86 family)
VKNGVVFQKVQSLEQVLTELRSLGVVTSPDLQDDWRTRRAVERDLQVLIEIVIDICQRVLALHDQTPAPTSRDAVERCVQLGVLSDDVAYRKMVQFRNFVVHRYEQVDVDILVDMVNHRLTDFERFRSEVLAYAKR